MPWEPLAEDVDNTRDLQQVLGVLHRRLGLARPDVLATLTENWVALLGSELAGMCTLESVKHDTIVIGTEDPAVADHLKWSSAELVSAANALCGGQVLAHLQVRVLRPGARPTGKACNEPG